MACTFDQADFGEPFTDLEPAVFAMFVELATSMVLGPPECQAATEAAWRACCVDPCMAIMLVTKHLIADDPAIDEVDKDNISERVGDVSTTYANVSSGDNPFSNTAYGRAFGYLQRKIIRCSHQRKHFPIGVPPTTKCSPRRGRW